ncbi:MAG: 3-dehydroquinate synthase [Ruminococcus sp.]|nr:3-dehydroquinate synthase [Ruminococcus sp.]
MLKVNVKASESYDILIESGLLAKTGEIINSLVKSKRIAIVTDDIVDVLYGDVVVESLKCNGFDVCKYVFPNGEHSKCSDNLNNIYDFLCENSITRTDSIIALGGGVVGDITGYASATYLRGVDYIQIPTTLLAQVDSSVGGKTAIDIPAGKNLVGAFKQPKCVICDIDTLKTLKRETFSDGMAEVIKYGMIRQKELFDILASHNMDTIWEVIQDVVFRCVSIKRDVVQNDEFDKGERMILNFGHTLGHAVEGYHHYETYTHGSAVAIGMCLITEKALAYGIGSQSMLNNLIECIKNYELPTSVPVQLKDLIPFCLADKKRESNNINIILCEDIGKCMVKKMPITDFYSFMGIS